MKVPNFHDFVSSSTIWFNFISQGINCHNVKHNQALHFFCLRLDAKLPTTTLRFCLWLMCSLSNSEFMSIKKKKKTPNLCPELDLELLGRCCPLYFFFIVGLTNLMLCGITFFLAGTHFGIHGLFPGPISLHPMIPSQLLVDAFLGATSFASVSYFFFFFFLGDNSFPQYP